MYASPSRLPTPVNRMWPRHAPTVASSPTTPRSRRSLCPPQRRSTRSTSKPRRSAYERGGPRRRRCEPSTSAEMSPRCHTSAEGRGGGDVSRPHPPRSRRDVAEISPRCRRDVAEMSPRCRRAAAVLPCSLYPMEAASAAAAPLSTVGNACAAAAWYSPRSACECRAIHLRRPIYIRCADRYEPGVRRCASPWRGRPCACGGGPS